MYVKNWLLMALLVATSGSNAWAQGATSAPLGPAEATSLGQSYDAMFADPAFTAKLDAAIAKRVDVVVPKAVEAAMQTERVKIVSAAQGAVIAALERAAPARTAAPAASTTSATGDVRPGVATATGTRVTTGTVQGTIAAPRQASAPAATQYVNNGMTYFRHDYGNRGVPMPVGGFKKCPKCGQSGTSSCIYDMGSSSGSSQQTCVRNADGTTSCSRNAGISSVYTQSMSSCVRNADGTTTCSGGGGNSNCTSCQNQNYGF